MKISQVLLKESGSKEKVTPQKNMFDIWPEGVPEVKGGGTRP